ncbi:uncharacterized protein [Euphorbia lathyris]|uniref:uncharacterized protein isoform X2 n=1 Tax=Euphorbia lathyris TaxID=212925 RepID=UPI0033138903
MINRLASFSPTALPTHHLEADRQQSSSLEYRQSHRSVSRLGLDSRANSTHGSLELTDIVSLYWRRSKVCWSTSDDRAILALPVIKTPRSESIEASSLSSNTTATSGMQSHSVTKGMQMYRFEHREKVSMTCVRGCSCSALPPSQRGELWLQGPTTMKGDEKAIAETLDLETWLKKRGYLLF